MAHILYSSRKAVKNDVKNCSSSAGFYSGLAILADYDVGACKDVVDEDEEVGTEERSDLVGTESFELGMFQKSHLVLHQLYVRRLQLAITKSDLGLAGIAYEGSESLQTSCVHPQRGDVVAVLAIRL